MMEKYGVSFEDLPPSDEQLRIIKDICKRTGMEYFIPKNAQEAIDFIEKTSSKE
ncbi:MAG: hypothetical protein N2749_01000 [Clostridia bacterium]|nr:hypothetical protein [Clostridia bacterium]